MNFLVTLLQLFGITKEQYPFLILGILIVAGAIYIRVVIGNKLGKVKDNVLIIITHLSSSASARGRLNTTLIQTMSPMTITNQGREVLKQSGFVAVMSTPPHRAEILKYVSEQNPRTRLDVESTAIVFFARLLESDFMNPIKTYLYDHPDTRDAYPTLAGIFIRDEYLREHPGITQ